MKLSLASLVLITLSTSASAEISVSVPAESGRWSSAVDIPFCGGTVSVSREEGKRNFAVRVRGSNCNYFDWGTNPGLNVAPINGGSHRQANALIDTIPDNGKGQYSTTWHAYEDCDKSYVVLRIRNKLSPEPSEGLLYHTINVQTSNLLQGNGGHDSCWDSRSAADNVEDPRHPGYGKNGVGYAAERSHGKREPDMPDYSPRYRR